MGPERDELLATYLNDHLSWATFEVELVRRLRASNGGDPRFGLPLRELCTEIEADRATLERLMDQLEIRRSPVKQFAGWASEKLGRLKLNGQLRGYSPLPAPIPPRRMRPIGNRASRWRRARRAVDFIALHSSYWRPSQEGGAMKYGAIEVRPIVER